MTVRHSHDELLPGPSCVTITIEMSYYFFFLVLLVLFSISHTHSDPLQVLSTMGPKQDRVYARG